MTDGRRRDWRGALLPFVVVAVDTTVLVLQKVKHHALLPAAQTRLLWDAVLVSLGCEVILR